MFPFGLDHIAIRVVWIDMQDICCMMPLVVTDLWALDHEQMNKGYSSLSNEIFCGAKYISMELVLVYIPNQRILQGRLRLYDCLSSWCLVLWINTCPLYVGIFFGKPFRNTLSCKFDRMESSFSLLCEYVLIEIIDIYIYIYIYDDGF